MAIFDVIIIGAGPAGSLAGYTLASKGFKVLIIEKNHFPRYKVCGGGLTHKILNEIPFDLSPVIESEIYSFRFSNHFNKIFIRESSRPLMYCTQRNLLDDFLVEQAKKAGSDIITGEKVVSFIQDKEGVTVSTQNKTIRAKMLIGADGAAGIVARQSGLNKSIKAGMAWEAEVTAESEDLKRFSRTVYLDWGTVPGGYAWIFPKADHFSIGVGGPATLAGCMTDYYRGFISSVSSGDHNNSGTGINFLETLSFKSWPIPVRSARSLFHNGRVIVTGDAAGLGDPLTGEGIYYAIRSGIIAADCGLEFLTGKTSSLIKYTSRVNGELMSELLEANRIRHLFTTAPLKIHNLVDKSDRAWGAFGKILRGERLYVDVKNGFGRWKLAWGLICLLGGAAGRIKEKRFLRNMSDNKEYDQVKPQAIS